MANDIKIKLLGDHAAFVDGERVAARSFRASWLLAIMAVESVESPDGLFPEALENLMVRGGSEHDFPSGLLALLRKDLGVEIIPRRGRGPVKLCLEKVKVDLILMRDALEENKYADAAGHYGGRFLAGLKSGDRPGDVLTVEGLRWLHAHHAQVEMEYGLCLRDPSRIDTAFSNYQEALASENLGRPETRLQNLHRRLTLKVQALQEPTQATDERDSAIRSGPQATRFPPLCEPLDLSDIEKSISSPEMVEIQSSLVEIASLAVMPMEPCQRLAVSDALRTCVENVRRVSEGQLLIPGRESGYFKRQLEVIENSIEPEHLKAFICLNVFKPEELPGKAWFDGVYSRYKQLVKQGRLSVDYIFLVQNVPPTRAVEEFLERFESFASRIAVLAEDDPRLNPELLRPSVVLLETQRIAFTHDRGTGSLLNDVSQWLGDDHFTRLQERYRQIELISVFHYVRSRE